MSLKDKIIAVSKELFALNGYEKTTIGDIIETAGASKGGFYHHFNSKDEILEELTMEYISTAETEYGLVLADPNQTVIEKFISSYYKLGEHKKDVLHDADRIQKTYDFEGNHYLFKKMGEAFEEVTARFFYKLLEKGIHEGAFQTDYPQELAYLWSREVIKFYRVTRKILSGTDGNEEQFYRTLKFNEQLINSQLGLKQGEIALEKMGRHYLQDMKIALGKGDSSNDYMV